MYTFAAESIDRIHYPKKFEMILHIKNQHFIYEVIGPTIKNDGLENLLELRICGKTSLRARFWELRTN